MRIIVHCEDPNDMIFAMKAVKAALQDGREQCAYSFGDPEEASAYAYRNKTGWSVRVEREKY